MMKPFHIPQQTNERWDESPPPCTSPPTSIIANIMDRKPPAHFCLRTALQQVYRTTKQTYDGRQGCSWDEDTRIEAQ
ncbi:hypothetical protein HJC23_012876 [Cyclotella cryptica]|uniref:Uncharacterized protein n=1 Tax=Cyclotella cryptica TaxID=29204 RepID=A0ABD3Q170_9STRA